MGRRVPVDRAHASNERLPHCIDFADYVACHQRAEATYLDCETWTKMSNRNVAHMGRFSNDRTIREYAEEIGQIEVSS